MSDNNPEYDQDAHQYWWPLHVAITWQPCVVVRRTRSRESYAWKYEIVDVWPRPSDLNYPNETARYCKVAEY